VQLASEGAVEIVLGDQFDDVGKIFVHPPRVALAAGELGFDESR
jgi:hypothetical protein